jgi:hypothetical protein
VLKYQKFELPSVESFRNLRFIRIEYWHVLHLNKKKVVAVGNVPLKKIVNYQ